eukprot:364577-Chlamydomonas_euryale.AAC.32
MHLDGRFDGKLFRQTFPLLNKCGLSGKSHPPQRAGGWPKREAARRTARVCSQPECAPLSQTLRSTLFGRA